MIQIQKICWNVTSKCNKNCKYCFKFVENDLSFQMNKIILNKLSKLGVNEITFSGGEPFMYDSFYKLLKLSKSKNINNNIITNASLLDENNINQYLHYIDKLILSLDFVDDNKNKEFGMGTNYYKHLSKILKIVNKNNKRIKIQVNTVLFDGNYQSLNLLMTELKKYNIDTWKIIRFIPLRGKALREKEKLAITDNQFLQVVNSLTKANVNYKIKIDDNKAMLKTHYILLSSGKLIKSINGDDILIDDLVEKGDKNGG